jgi:hypothetical protein
VTPTIVLNQGANDCILDSPAVQVGADFVADPELSIRLASLGLARERMYPYHEANRKVRCTLLLKIPAGHSIHELAFVELVSGTFDHPSILY